MVSLTAEKMVINSAIAFTGQQTGNLIWRNGDIAMRKLRNLNQHCYTQMLSLSNDEEIKDMPIFACKFSPQEGYGHLVGLANEEGKLAVHNTISSSRYGIFAHNNAIFDLAWMYHHMKLVTASGDHTAKLYDVSNEGIQEEKAFFGHTRSVKTVAFQKECAFVFATGGRDGVINLWDTRAKMETGTVISKPDNRMFNSHSSKANTPAKPKRRLRRNSIPAPMPSVKTVTGLVFQDENTLISCGAGDGIIKVWDLRKNYCFHTKEPVPKWTIPYSGCSSNGFSSLLIDNKGIKLYANCLDNTIYSYNVATYNPSPLMRYTGHETNTFYIKSSLSTDGEYLVSGSSDECAYIWNTKYSKPIVKLKGHLAEVTCVSWCGNNNNMLITCSDDMTHKLWTIEPGLPPEERTSIGQGIAEPLPYISLEQSQPSQLKRKFSCLNPEKIATPKRFLQTCTQCDHSPMVSAGTCENCSPAVKHKPLPTSPKDLQPKRLELGPRRLFNNLTEPSNAENADLFDTKLLTQNLPNYVEDGVAPHLNFSPPKRRNQDWLTKMRIERDLRKEMVTRTLQAQSPKACRPEESQKRSGRAQSPLLRFFKVTNTGLGKCDGNLASSSKSSNSFVALDSQVNQ